MDFGPAVVLNETSCTRKDSPALAEAKRRPRPLRQLASCKALGSSPGRGSARCGLYDRPAASAKARASLLCIPIAVVARDCSKALHPAPCQTHCQIRHPDADAASPALSAADPASPGASPAAAGRSSQSDGPPQDRVGQGRLQDENPRPGAQGGGTETAAERRGHFSRGFAPINNEARRALKGRREGA